jgi:hypothetical protein
MTVPPNRCKNNCYGFRVFASSSASGRPHYFFRYPFTIYINPVKHGLVTRVRDWPFSSFHRDVAAGLFPEDWAGDFNVEGQFGEA